MDPFDDWRRRRKAGDPFANFEAEFEQMRSHFDQMFRDMVRNLQAMPPMPNPKDLKPGQPFVYGFSMRVGPDGKPQIQQFGNTGPVAPTPTGVAEVGREPITDIIEGDREIAVTVELPGVEKKDINLHVAPQRLTIRVETPRKYHKVLDLPAKVRPESAQATYKNGILDVTLERESKREEPGHRVDIR
ncbi:MAG TPA: archaeal heat shock protein Hsp20 [Candidatus Thermoplasmatota archaeon]|nr:archaeal heat shock protein Hsp20 [Candidatus Thermoplasmatota archaeon]